MSKSLEKRIEEAIDTSLEDTSTSLGERRKLKRNILKQVRQERREEEKEETGVNKDLTRRKFLKMLGIGTGGLALSSSAAGLFKITDQPQTSTINADTIDGTLISGTPPIPDSENVQNRWPLDEGSGQTGADAVGNDDLSFNFENWVSGDYIGGFAKDFDGAGDEGDSPATAPVGDMTMAMTIEFG